MGVIDPIDIVAVEGRTLLNMESDVRQLEYESKLVRDALLFLADMHNHEMDSEGERFASCLRLVAFSMHPSKRPAVKMLGDQIRNLIRKEEQ